MHPQPLYGIGQFWSSDRNTDVQITVNVSDKQFQIDILTSNIKPSPKLLEQYLLHVKRSNPDFVPNDTKDNELVDPVEALHEWALKPFIPYFAKIPPLNSARKYTLQDCLFPTPLRYTLKAVDDQLVPCPLNTKARTRPVGALLPESAQEDYSRFPVYRPYEVQVPISKDATTLPTLISKVLLKDQQVCFFKQVLAGDINSTVRELTAYAKIQAVDFDSEVRTARLIGIVKDEKTSRIVGLLLSYIKHEEGITLLYRGCDQKCLSLRSKWIGQITYTLNKLHEHGVVWGDGKPVNTVIDESDDAYLVDFGGGYTNGWVDEEFANSDQGDLQALERIREWLYQ